MPTVSIVIPTFNRSGYLQKAIKSVLAQSLTDIEIIIVDDGSQDNTPKIVKNYSDNRIQYFYQTNTGRSAARNKGMERSSGIFISLLDDDDVYLPQKLEHQVGFLEMHPPYDAVASAGYIIDENDNINGIFQPWPCKLEITLPECIHKTGIPPSSLLFRRRCLDRMDYWFDTKINYAEDNDFIIRLLLTGRRISWLPRALWSYRRYGKRSGYVQLAPTLAFHDILERMFARSDLPLNIVREKSVIMAKSHLTIACVAYVLNLIKLGKIHVQKALELNPSLMEGFPPHICRVFCKFKRTLKTTKQ